MDASSLPPPEKAEEPGLPSRSNPAGISGVRKLYLPYGGFPRYLRLRRGLPGENGLVLHWFCAHRPEPVAPYPDLILNYGGLSAAMRSRAEGMVDEMFTEEEFGLLRDYLFQRYGEDTRTTVLTAPFHPHKLEDVTRAAANRPFLQMSGRADSDTPAAPLPGNDALFAKGFYRLSDEEDCSLPFEVRGYYTPAVIRVRRGQTLSPGELPDGDAKDNEVALLPQ